MSLKKAAVAPIALLASACLPPDTGVEAPYSAALQLPEDIVLAWNQAYNETEDGIGALVMMDLLVYDADSGYPMDNIRVEVMSLWGGIYPIPQTAIKTVPGPGQPAAGECDADGDGQIDLDAPDACSWFWDTSGEPILRVGERVRRRLQPQLDVRQDRRAWAPPGLRLCGFDANQHIG